MKQDFLKLSDLKRSDIEAIINRAIELKNGKDKGLCPLIGKNIGLFFEKPSTRTRISFEAGIYQLGGNAITMTPDELQIGRGESIADTARTVSRYLDAIMLRTFSHNTLKKFAQYSTIPVINGLCDIHHPCQALADAMTLREQKGHLTGLKVAFIGDGNNVCNSLIEAAALLNFHLTIACPEGFEPYAPVLEHARSYAKSELIVVRDPREAVSKADAIYTDVWVSMGQENEAEFKRKRFLSYQINEELLSHAKRDAIILHCLPAHRGEEITDEVIDGPQSVVFDQAENRLHTQKALLEMLIR